MIVDLCIFAVVSPIFYESDSKGKPGKCREEIRYD